MTQLNRAALTGALAQIQPRNRCQLAAWVRAVLGIRVPARARCAEHHSPLDYLDHAFFEHGGDLIIWANRGGGKTFYGAVATLLDLIFKPGIHVRLLGGSFDQSSKMYRYLRWMLDREGLRQLVEGSMTQRGVRLVNGSEVELLAQSQTSVRGQRVQKLRCDEVELFDPDVWAAAQFVTRSAWCGGRLVRGSVECFSTMHRPFGLMSQLVSEADQPARVIDDAGDDRQVRNDRSGWRLIKWCALDVINRCDAARNCEDCSLNRACGGTAKRGSGFVTVEDVLAQQRRSSEAVFDSEMLCRRPSRRDVVYPHFDIPLHVRAVEADAKLTWIGGMDFGLRSPLVMIWAQLRPVAGGAVRVEVIDAYIEPDRTLGEHLRAIEARGWPRVRWVGVDPAGHQRNDQTGRSAIAVLELAGWKVRATRHAVAAGVEVVRRRLEVRDATGRPAAVGMGDPGLVIHPRCRGLIEAISQYHFAVDDPMNERPVKDGHDHAADALRYMLVNLEQPSGKVEARRY